MPTFDYKKEYERYRRYYLSMEPLFTKPAGRAYTSIIFSFLAVSLFGWYAIRPTMQTILTLKRQITDRTQIDKKMEDKISALIEAQAAFQDVEQHIPVITQALPTIPEPVAAVAQIQGLARESNVRISGLSVPTLGLGQIQTAPPTVGHYSIGISIAGGYADVKNFLQHIQNLRRIIHIESMAFSPRVVSPTLDGASASATPVSTGTIVQVDLKLNVYYLGQPTTAL